MTHQSKKQENQKIKKLTYKTKKLLEGFWSKLLQKIKEIWIQRVGLGFFILFWNVILFPSTYTGSCFFHWMHAWLSPGDAGGAWADYEGSGNEAVVYRPAEEQTARPQLFRDSASAAVRENEPGWLSFSTYHVSLLPSVCIDTVLLKCLNSKLFT